MGVVFMAEQTRTVHRRVALKVIKPGMDSRQVIARFEAERQALAMMEHPNIARVLDAGSTDSGRPYFVMELVRGVPITEYCDVNRLDAEDRMKLFVTACLAIQHAHQKGIIHRDIKPSNVMVTLQDGRPVAKVIDFGIAKATEQKLTEKTLFTAYGQMIGTPAYMSPEQAEMGEVDVDTRSDIYSLGVLLYELLTGTTPIAFDAAAIRGLRRDPAADPRGEPAAAELAAEHAGRGRDRAGGESRDRPRAAGAAPGGRPRLDHDEGPREGPRPPVRHGRRPRRGRRAVPPPRGRRGPPAVGDLSPRDVRPAAPRRRDGRDGGGAGPCRRDRRRGLAGGRGPSGEADRPGQGGGDAGGADVPGRPHPRRRPAQGPRRRTRPGGRASCGHRGRRADRGSRLQGPAPHRGPAAPDPGKHLPVPGRRDGRGGPIRTGASHLHEAPRPRSSRHDQLRHPARDQLPGARARRARASSCSERSCRSPGPDSARTPRRRSIA